MIKLFPPFLFQEETNDFDEVWENFCREILKLENKSDNFIKRIPPENGVDIFFKDNKTAYQCKSTIYGTSNGHNLTKIVASYKDALKIKDELGWQKYILCINYDLTGVQESNLKKEIPEIEILAGSYWIDKAKKHFSIIKDYFRLVISLKKDRVNNAISSAFIPEYSDKLKSLLKTTSYKIYVWCNRNTSLYELLVSPDFTIEDLLHIIKKAWPYPLPEPMEIGPYKVGLSYSIVHNEKKQPFKNKISEVGIVENELITFWTTITYADNENNRRSGNYIEMITINRVRNSERITANEAIAKYSKIIQKRFKEIDEILMNE